MSAYPVVYEADYVEKRSRLTTFFRYFLMIPHFIVLIVLEIGLAFAVFIAWFALLFTGRWPQGLYDFTAGVLRYMTRLNAYMYLAADPYPPFDMQEHPEYPIRLRVAPPKESYSRVKVFFRGLLAIPVMLIYYALSLVMQIGAFLSWFVIVFTGKQPEGLQNMINLGVGYGARGYAYMLLLTEDFPPFSSEDQETVPPAPATTL